jgi:hypothetical protein
MRQESRLKVWLKTIFLLPLDTKPQEETTRHKNTTHILERDLIIGMFVISGYVLSMK